VIVSTEWCPNCPQYIAQIASQANALDANGSLLLFMDMQTTTGGSPSSESANAYINQYAPQNVGIRVGDAVISPANSFANIYSFIPNGFVVRRSDMTIVAHQETSSGLVPYVSVAQDPNADWGAALPPFVANCTEAEEEIYEPNDTPDEAAAIAPGTFEGGICTQQADYYLVDIAGDWQIFLEFTHAVGDLDIHRIVNGDSVQQAWGVVDNETMVASGPALIAVVGYLGASAPYTLTLSEL